MADLTDYIPGGGWTLAAVGLLTVPGVRNQVRPVAKVVVRAGLVVADGLKEFVAEAREQTEDLVAEARADREGTTASPTTEVATEPAKARSRRTSQAEAGV